MEKMVITNKSTKAELIKYINELEKVVFAEIVAQGVEAPKEEPAVDVKGEAVKKLIDASLNDLHDIRDIHLDAKFKGFGKKKAFALNTEIICLINSYEGTLISIKKFYE